jgi:hypothetical protein
MSNGKEQAEIAEKWMVNGTQILAIVLKRLSGDQPVTITREELEAEFFKSSHPVVFDIMEDRVVMTVPKNDKP